MDESKEPVSAVADISAGEEDNSVAEDSFSRRSSCRTRSSCGSPSPNKMSPHDSAASNLSSSDGDNDTRGAHGDSEESIEVNSI